MVQDICPLCGCRGDTIFHRVWKCLHPDAVAARCRAAPQWLRDEVDRGTVNRTLCTKGLIPHPGDVWPRPAGEATPTAHYDGGGERPLTSEGVPIIPGSIYVDGSCTTHVITELRRAGTSLVARDQRGDVTWRINMAVPTPMPQSSQASEFIALPLVQAYIGGTEGDVDVASDCLNVVRACREPTARVLNGSKLYAGLMKPIRSDTAWCSRVRVRKVPAHVDPRTLQPGPARDDAVANGVADTEAKKAVDLHPKPAPAQLQILDAELKRARLAVRTIAAVMPVFPSMPRERMVRPPPLREGASLRGSGGHEWVYTAGHWRCAVCWALTVKQDIDPERLHQACGGPKQSLTALAIAARGHKLAQAEGAVPILFCMDCGSFSARRAYGLGSTCPKVPTSAGKQALARIRRGLQPWQARHERRSSRPRLGPIAAWDDNRKRYARGDGEPACKRRRQGAPLPQTSDSATAAAPNEARAAGDLVLRTNDDMDIDDADTSRQMNDATPTSADDPAGAPRGDQSGSGHREHRLCAPGQGPHRLDLPHVAGGSIDARAPAARTDDQQDKVEESRGVQHHRRGSTEGAPGANAPLANGAVSVECVSSSLSHASAHVRSLRDLGSGVGGAPSDALHPPVHERAHPPRRGRRELGDSARRQVSRSPRREPRGQGGAASAPTAASLPHHLTSSSDMDGAQIAEPLSRDDEYIRPWERRPDWEYLPHLAACTPGSPTSTTSATASSTSGAVRASGGGTRGPAAAAEIRGHVKVPGPARLRASIQRSLDDHADRVAAKRARITGAETDAASPSPAQRLQALRERIRQRTSGSSEGGATFVGGVQPLPIAAVPRAAARRDPGTACAATRIPVESVHSGSSHADLAAAAAASQVAWHTSSSSSSALA